MNLNFKHMGYSNWPIAVVGEPAQLSLSNTPSFLTVDRTETGTRVRLRIDITVGTAPFPTNIYLLRITKALTGEILEFEGTTVAAEAVGRKFRIQSIPAWQNAQNLQYALLSDPWIRANFNVTIPLSISGSTVSNGQTIVIQSKGFGAEYQIGITTPNDPTNVAYSINPISPTTYNQDSISDNYMTSQIDAHVYEMPSIMLGQNDLPDVPAKMGTFAVTLNKTYYSGKQTWFDLNNIFGNAQNFNMPPGAPGWFDTGTMTRYRIVLQNNRSGVHVPFFTTNTFYVLNGYSRAFEKIDMQEYIFKAGKTSVKLLTNKPQTTYVKGQREFLNFVLSDPYRGTLTPGPINLSFEMHILYKCYTASGDFIAVTLGASAYVFDMPEVNTCELDIGSVLEAYPDTGLLEVYLAYNVEDSGVAPAEISNPLRYIVRPENISKENTLIFLNALGGWDSYNADADTTDSFKLESETFLKTVTPQSDKGDAIEATYSANLDEEFTIEGAPVKDEIAEWLKELTVSKAVLYKGRRILINDVSLTRDNSNFYRPVIKFKYSESFTNV